mgnify:CR=1 FL=1
MIFTLANIIAAVLYAALAASLATQLIRQTTTNVHYFLGGIAATLGFHEIGRAHV